jgi:hypothetical protein
LTRLDERNKRRFVGVLASQEGNILQLSKITGLSRNTIYKGQREVEHPRQNSASGIRHSGAGRLRVEKNSPRFWKHWKKFYEMRLRATQSQDWNGHGKHLANLHVNWDGKASRLDVTQLSV